MARKGGKPKGITKTRRERMAKALQLREGGASYKKIAELLGVSEGMAFRDVKEALQEITREPAESLLTLELSRLDAMWIPHYAKARKGDLKATQACLRIHERRCKLLGLERPDTSGMEKAMDVLMAGFQLVDKTPDDDLSLRCDAELDDPTDYGVTFTGEGA